MRLTELYITNFLSFGPDVHITFDGRTPILIKGTTKTGDDSNGSGKSSLFEAIYWCFTGKTIRTINSADVIRFGQKNVKVKVCFEIKGKLVEVTRYWSAGKKRMSIRNDGKQYEYHVVRDGKKDLFEILGTNETCLALACFYGRRYLTFSGMTSSERASLLSTLAKTTEWERCEQEVRTQISKVLGKIKEKDTILNVKQNDVKKCIIEANETQKLINNYAKDNKVELQQAENDIKELTECIAQIDKDVEGLRSAIQEENDKTKADDDLDELHKYESELKKCNENERVILESIYKLNNLCDSTLATIEKKSRLCEKELPAKIELIKQNIEKYETLLQGTCPTCEQEILNHEHTEKWRSQIEVLTDEQNKKLVIIQELENEIIELNNTLLLHKKNRTNAQDNHAKAKTNTAIAQERVDKTRKEVKEKQKNSRVLYDKLSKLQQERKDMVDDVILVKEQKKQIEDHLDKLKEKKKLNDSKVLVFNDEITELQKQKQSIQQELYRLEFWKDGFKSIKYGVFGDLCEFLESLLVEFLKQQDLDFDGIRIITSKEKVSGGEKACVDIAIIRNGREIPLGALSEGETQRVDIACYVAFSELIRSTSGFAPDLLIMDEPLTGIDLAGKKKIFDLINGLAIQRQIFVIDHNADFSDMFTGVMEVTKNDYSDVILHA